eukprot:4456709-Amphidinium_carterae.1
MKHPSLYVLFFFPNQVCVCVVAVALAPRWRAQLHLPRLSNHHEKGPRVVTGAGPWRYVKEEVFACTDSDTELPQEQPS